MRSRRKHPTHVLVLLILTTLVSSIAASSAAARPASDDGELTMMAPKHTGPSAPANTSLPSISGQAISGSTLTASPGSWSGSSTSFSYSWSSCSTSSCAAIANATAATYALGAADVGSTITVVVTARNAHGSASATSPAVGPIAPAPSSPPPSSSPPPPPPPSAPTSTSAPAISGTPMQGSVLTTSTGTWTGSPSGYAYQWLRCDSTGASCSPFTTGNGLPTYSLTVLDVGAKMKVTVTATNSGGSGNTTSGSTALVAPPPAPPAPTPVVAISAPATGATVSGAIAFTATVTNATPTQVVFTIDGAGPFPEYQAPYVYNGDGNTLDTTTLSNGTHTLAASATFSDGSSVSTSETVTVSNTTPSPPSPPPPAGSSNGIGVMRFGSSWSSGSGYDRYGYVLVGYGDVDAAAALPGTSLVYKGGVDVTDTTNTDLGMNIGGVGYKQALASGWLLKDASGNYVKSPSYGDWLGDVGDSNFQKAWVDNVSTFLLAHHADGVFIDNVLCSITGLSGGTVPAKYPTDAAWANAQAAFLAYVGPAMHAKGLYVAVNAYCGGTNNGSANAAWWTRIAPYVDAELNEYFEQNPNNTGQLFFNAPTVSWMGNWLGMLDVITAAQNAGKAALALSYGAGSNTTAMMYGKASFLLVWNGTSGGFVYNPTDSTDPWNPAWTAAIGTPTGSMTQVGNAYVRDYTGGYVVVNPSVATVSVPLPTGLKTLSGAAAGSSVSLATTTAAIFTK